MTSTTSSTPATPTTPATSSPHADSAYAASGVDYDVLDEVKRQSVALAAATAGLLGARGGQELAASRGSSAYVFTLGGQTLALVVEGLGTKALIAQEFLALTGISRFADIATDAVGCIVNDVVSVGALPAVVNAYFATGDAAWYADPRRSQELLAGWQRACIDSGATWGGGESPALPGLVTGEGIELGGAALGCFPAEATPVLGEHLAAGQQIVLLESSGLHANGASLARRLAGELPEGWLTRLPSGRSFGEAVLDASILYPRFVAGLWQAGVRPSFLNGITGHGLRKLLRAPAEVSYHLHTLPQVPEVLEFMASHAGMDQEQAYSTLNMGAGFVAIVEPDQVEATLAVAAECGHAALLAGEVGCGPRAVHLASLGITYGADSLDLGTAR